MKNTKIVSDVSIATQSNIIPPKGVIVIFGNGNVTTVKVHPALCQLLANHKIGNQPILVVANNLSTEGAEKALLRQDLLDTKFTEKQVTDYLELVHYMSADLLNPEFYSSIKSSIDQLANQYNLQGHNLYYLGLGNSLFPNVIKALGENGFLTDRSNKILIEKPYGVSITEAKALNQLVANYCEESQVYRIDHYLLKETLQNLMSWRLANPWASQWNGNEIESITILALESVKVFNRPSYDGAYIDMIPNHLLEILALCTMETPISLDSEDIRNEKVKVLRCATSDPESLVIGQYEGYENDNPKAPHKETLAAVNLTIQHPRWQNVRFNIITGKAVDRKCTQVIVKFRNTSLLFPNNNKLIFNIQPNEGIVWETAIKSIGEQKIVTKPLIWSYGDETPIPEAYETLFEQALQGNSSLFVRGDEVEALWLACEPAIQRLKIYQNNGNGFTNNRIYRYPVGLTPNTLLEFIGLNNWL